MLAFLFLACSHSTDPSDSASGDTGWTEEAAATSDGGSFYMMYSADPAPIPFNEPFQLIAMVHDGADHNLMYNDASVVVNATMPGHGHGMNTEPSVTMDEVGMITVDGMLFHMRG